ncbi:hypothetical protein M0804_001566 [Polistes exclamans]|nr:hypothetical protein M0804_001566 [Polistes exclamans]
MLDYATENYILSSVSQLIGCGPILGRVQFLMCCEMIAAILRQRLRERVMSNQLGADKQRDFFPVDFTKDSRRSRGFCPLIGTTVASCDEPLTLNTKGA